MGGEHKTMKSLIASIMILGVVGMVVGVAVLADTESTVTATVTVQSISVSVTDGIVAYGTLAAGASTSTLAGELNDLQTATNNGNVTEDFNIRGQVSSPAGWTLGASAGNNVYVHEFSTNSFATSSPLTTSNQTLAIGITVASTQDFDLKITTPTATDNYEQQSVDVTVQVTAS